MGTVCLKLGTSKRPGELDLAIRRVVARAIGTRRKNNREISRSSDSRRNRASDCSEMVGAMARRR